MGAGTATDEVTDAIAHIEMHRQEMEKEAGIGAACSEALRKLHVLLDREKQALQLHGPGTDHAANVEAVTAEIKRVKNLAGTGSRGPIPQSARPGQRRMPWQNAPRNPSRKHRGRRTMGRTGGR